MITAATLKAMVKAGCTAQQLIALVEADEMANKERLAEKREQTRIRVQKHRARNKSNALHSVTERYTPPPDGSSPEPLSPLPPPPSPPKGGSVPPTPKTELAVVLDADHVKAVIDHRAKIRKPLTAHAAKLLAGKFRACADPNGAADTMIANAWQGFEPEWLDGRGNSRPRAPPREPDLADFFAEKARRLQEEEDAHTIETSYERRDFDGPRKAVSRPPATEG